MYKRTCSMSMALVVAITPARMTDSAMAQQAPPPPTPPPEVTIIDLGDVGIGDTVLSDVLPIAGGQNIWFRFRLTAGISPKTWLSIDTSRSTINTELGLYNKWTYYVADDDFSGGGTTLGNSTASALTFGGGSGQRLGEDGGGWFGSRIDTGWNQHVGSSQLSGGWRPYLGAGEYYVVVVGYNADFSQSPNPNFQVSTNFIGSGTIRLRLKTGEVSSTYWNEYHHGGDAGSTPETAQVVDGTGPLTTLVAAFHPGERDMFKIRICDPENFQVTTTLTLSWGNTYRGTLFLFDADGRGVLGINNTIAGTDTILSVPDSVTLAPGDYYVAVSSYCGGIAGFQHVPYDGTDNALWDFSQPSSWNQSIPPNGTGQANPMSYMGAQSDCEANSDFYFVRMALVGACHVQNANPDCPGDLDGDGDVDQADLGVVLAYYGVICP